MESHYLAWTEDVHNQFETTIETLPYLSDVITTGQRALTHYTTGQEMKSKVVDIDRATFKVSKLY